MIREIKRVAELQLEYSSENTPAMSERGQIIRVDLPDFLRKHISEFENGLGRFFSELKIEGRDGIGRKTEAPWVRLYSATLSPSATIGFYVVIHFALDGSKFFVTIGCAATKWDNERGDLIKQSMIEEIANRYLQREKIPELALEFGIKKCQLYKILRDRAGDTWIQNVRCTELGIEERIETKIPPLLSKSVIQAINRKSEENRTWDKDQRSKCKDMLGGFIFCSGCGQAMTPESSRGMVRYRHKKNENCPFNPCPSVRQDLIETAVMEELVQMLEDPKRLYQRLFVQNTPNSQRIDEVNQTIKRLEKQLSEIQMKRATILDLDLGKVSQNALESKLLKLELEEEHVQKRLEALLAEREAELTERKIRKAAKEYLSAAQKRIQIRKAVHPPTMTVENAKTILRDTCGGKLPNGKRMGVYVTPIDTDYGSKFKCFKFEIKGGVQAYGITDAVPNSASCSRDRGRL